MPSNHGLDTPDVGHQSGDLAPIHPARAIVTVTVAVEGRPDRRTINPRGLSGDALMATWLTANASAFVDLEDAR